MALTQIPIELSSTPGIVDNSNATAITIDSSENVLVGKTSVGQAIVGCELRSDRAVVTRDGGTPLTLNRLTSPGSILELLEDGTTVGSIGSNGGDVYIGTGDTTIRFVDGDDAIIPRGTAGAVRDGAIDLGISNNRFKDIYLSGGAYLGGTAAANKLDDYEEGTWTPTINSGTIVATNATYTKIGRKVTIQAKIADISDNTSTADITLSGLPFTALSDNISVGSVMFRYFSKANATQMTPYISPTSSSLVFYWSFDGNTIWQVVEFQDGSQANMDIIFTTTYNTA